jgi:hypothetical protein
MWYISFAKKKITQAITINQTLELAKDEPNKPKVKKYDSRVNKKKKEIVSKKKEGNSSY